MSKSNSKPSSARSRVDPEEDAFRRGAESGREDGDFDAATDGGGEESEREQLERALVRKGLSDIARTTERSGGDGGAQGFAFTRLDLSGQSVRTLEGEALAAYPHLRYANVSNNEIADLAPLSALPRLLSLQAMHNQLADVSPFLALEFPQMQLLQLDHNEIEFILTRAAAADGKKGAARLALSARFPSLFALTLSNNKLASLARAEEVGVAELSRDGHPALQVLDVAFNQLTSLAGLAAFPHLRVLNLQANGLTSLEGIERCKALEKLNVTDNKLASLPAELERLKQLPNLTSLLIQGGNQGLLEEATLAAEAALAAAEEKGEALPEGTGSGPGGLIDLTSDILIALPRLVHLDGRRVTAAQRARADGLNKERQEAKERREAEEAEAKKLALAEEEAERKAREEEEKEAGEDAENEDDEDAEENGGEDGAAAEGGEDFGDDGADGGEQFDGDDQGEEEGGDEDV